MDFVPITLPPIIVDLCTKESCELTTADQRKTHDDKSRVLISLQSSFICFVHMNSFNYNGFK